MKLVTRSGKSRIRPFLFKLSVFGLILLAGMVDEYPQPHLARRNA
jgi:hypothetical protein